MEEKRQLKGVCRNCKNPLFYEEGQQVVHCMYCEQDTLVSEMSSVNTSNAATAVSGAAAIMASIDNADSALAYLENFFEGFNWDEFNETAELTIASVDKMVETNLIKGAANPSTWELQFKSIATPLLKKVEGLKDLEAKFLKVYEESVDVTEGLRIFDFYARNSKAIVSSKEAIVKKLELAITFAKKYSAKPALVTELQTILDSSVKPALDSVKEVESFKDLPGFDKAEKNKQKLVADRLAKKGINAEEVYNNAVAAFQSGDNTRETLAKFNEVYGYKDAAKYYDALNVWVRFGNEKEELIKLGNKFYILRDQKVTEISINPLTKGNGKGKKDKAPAVSEEEESALGLMRKEMLEVVDGNIASTPVVKDITLILTHYGSHMFYIKNNRTICSYNSLAQNDAVKEHIKAKPGDFTSVSGDINYYTYKNFLFLKQKLAAKLQKAGCVKKLFGKKDQIIVSDNNYAVTAIDLATNEVSTIIPEIIDIMDVYGEEIFFLKAAVVDKIKRNEFYAYNVFTKETRKVLSQDNEIASVVDGKVIYMTWVPNQYNKNLYALDFKTGESVLLEKNIYKFFKTINNKVYYVVGNQFNKTLFCINTDGTDRVEVLQNANSLDASNTIVIGGWIYLKKGKGINSVLFKISADGKNVILLCTQYASMIKIKDATLYYKNTFGSLCSVRLDGSDRKELVPQMTVVSVDDNGIYFVRREYVGKSIDRSIVGAFAPAEKIYNNTLYKVDIDGHNIYKIAFNINAVAENRYNKNELYISKNEIVTYEIATPINKKEYSVEYQTRKLLEYLKYDKTTGELSNVLELGAAHASSVEFKGGCLKKKVSKDQIITIVPNKIVYERDDVATGGEVAVEKTEEIKNSNAKKGILDKIKGFLPKKK